jgi:mevalonate pyrophosphate decarboxylase
MMFSIDAFSSQLKCLCIFNFEKDFIMTSKLISLSITAIALAASASSFASTSTAEYNYPVDTPFVSQLTRAQVQAEASGARAFLTQPEALFGSVTRGSASKSELTRDEVRMQALEFTRAHKAADEIRG